MTAKAVAMSPPYAWGDHLCLGRWVCQAACLGLCTFRSTSLSGHVTGNVLQRT